MPAMNRMLLSTSLLVLALGSVANAAGPAVPNFGPATVLASAEPAPSGSPGVPNSLRAPASAALDTRRPVTPGVNPFAPAAPVAAPAPASPASAAGAFKPDTPPAPDAAAAGAAEQPDAVDEAALRYYASQRDLGRVGAEIRRLKALHPEWQPPADLFADKAQADEGAFWDLLAKKDFAALDAAMAARAKATPGWRPSADLGSKIEFAKARETIQSAASSNDWQSVTMAAGRYPSALTCANMDLLWSLGEAYARLGDLSRSFDLYGYILKSCDNPAERLATYQKAAALLPPEGAEALAGFGRTEPNGASEFAGLSLDPVRAAMGKVAGGETTEPVDAAKLDTFAAEIGRSRSQSDALLFGWYLYALQDFAGAADWFKAATQLGPDPKATEGTILALRGAGQADEAAKLAFANRARSPEIANIYVEILSGRLTENDASATLDEATLRNFSATVDQSKSALGAQSLGWNLLARDDLDGARTWFRKSVEWQPTQEGVTGLAVVASRSKNAAELKEVRARFGDDFPALNSVSVASAQPARPAVKAVRKAGSAAKKGGGKESALMAEANAAFKARDYKKALALLDQRKTLYGQNGGAEVLRGWANLKLGRYDEARRVFKAENSKRSTKDTRFGIGAVSNEQYGMWE